MTEIISQPSPEEVGEKARTATIWVLGLLLARHTITLVTTMVTSRLVSPSDTGIAGMAATFVAFMVLLDTGLTWATVQPKSLTRTQVDTMFWLGVVGGTILLCISRAVSPLLASFFHAPELEKLGWVMGLTIFFNSLTIQPSALLKRALRQKQNNLIDAASLVASSIAAMGLAYLFRDYWALLLQAMLYPLLRFCLLLSWTKHRISAPAFDRSTIPVLRKGLGFAASNYVAYVQLYLPTILIGRMFGDAALGYYAKANALKAMPTMYASLVVTDIMISTIAVFQSEPEKLGEFYRKALGFIAFVGCFAGAMLFPLAPELVRILYGTQWEGVVPLLKLMAAGAMAAPISASFVWLFLACGKAKSQFRMNVILSVFAASIFLLLYKLNVGLRNVVLGEMMLSGIFPAISLYVSHRATSLRILDTVKKILPIIIASIASAGIACCVSFIPRVGLLESLVLKMTFGIASYLAVAYIGCREMMKDIYLIFSGFFCGKKQ